jgi:phage tail sheath gpL-like
MIIRLVVNTNKNNLISSLDTQGGPSAWYLRKLSNLFQAFSLGVWKSNTILVNNAVAATGTISPVSHVATDTITVCNITLTCSNSTQDATHYKPGASDTACAANMATCINANTHTSKIVSATAASGVVTLTSLVPGEIGNGLGLAISAHGSVGAFASGSEGNTSTFAHGL